MLETPQGETMSAPWTVLGSAARGGYGQFVLRCSPSESVGYPHLAKTLLVVCLLQ